MLQLEDGCGLRFDESMFLNQWLHASRSSKPKQGASRMYFFCAPLIINGMNFYVCVCVWVGKIHQMKTWTISVPQFHYGANQCISLFHSLLAFQRSITCSNISARQTSCPSCTVCNICNIYHVVFRPCFWLSCMLDARVSCRLTQT